MTSHYTSRRNLTDFQRTIIASKRNMTTNVVRQPPYLSAPQIWEHPIINHMVYVFSRQDDDEQQSKDTKYKNSRGFTAVDANICSSILIYVLKYQKISEKQMNILYNKCGKYTKQYPDEDFDVLEFRDEWLERNPLPQREEPIDNNEGCLIMDD